MKKSPFATIVSMIAKGDGPSGETRTRGILVPNQAPYQLGHTRMILRLRGTLPGSESHYTLPKEKMQQKLVPTAQDTSEPNAFPAAIPGSFHKPRGIADGS